MLLQIEFLANHPHLAETLAFYHYEQWRDLLTWWSYEQALAELQDHARRQTIPTTLIALQEGQLLGSASLVRQDLPEEELPGLASLSPWLASVYVVPAWRGKGIGTTLVEAAVAHAQTLGVTRLHLFTPGQEAFYLRLGWSVLDRVQHHGEAGSVMYKQIRET